MKEKTWDLENGNLKLSRLGNDGSYIYARIWEYLTLVEYVCLTAYVSMRDYPIKLESCLLQILQLFYSFPQAFPTATT